MQSAIIRKSENIISGHSLALFILVLLGCFQARVYAQCTTVTGQDIPDDDILIIPFYASGLTDADLSSPTQGICGIEINFMHEYLGDLTVTLISPSGQQIQLVGPTTTATGSTNLTLWDISFVPCAMVPVPDAGFSGTWSNLQGWQALTPYNGSYHPASGCLEDFNSGPANGTWQFIFEDHDIFQIGNVAEVSLIFCNPAGLNCSECNPNGGQLSPLAVQLCEGESFSSSGITVDYNGNIPPAPTYSYTYLFSSGNSILQSGPALSLSPAPGEYSVCGLSYLSTDIAQVNAAISTGNLDTIVQRISNGSICADLSDCSIVTVQSIPDTVKANANLCAGDVYIYRGHIYTSPGVYYQVVDGPANCDSVFQLTLTGSLLSAVITPPDTLHCTGGNLTLISSVFDNVGNVSYSWSTATGNIIGPVNNSGVAVNQPGQYMLTVSDAQCEVITSVTVVAANDFPRVFVEGGTITCTQPVLSISPIFVPTDASVVWTGPFGFTSFVPDVNIDVPGTYVFRVTNDLGCTVSKSIEIEIDTNTHPVTIVPVIKDCQIQAAYIGPMDGSNILSYTWNGPNGFTSTTSHPLINEAGIYALSAVFKNGCIRTDSYFFDGDYAIPDITGPPNDTLNCNEQITLELMSSTPGVSYTWSGPTGFISSSSAIVIEQSGIYTGVVYAPNGCSVQHLVEIVQGDDIFPFGVFSDTLNCRMDTIQIGVVAPDADLFEWLNYSGSDKFEPMITISIPGLYTVMMIDTHSGCSVTASLLVPSDFTYPVFGYYADTITCDDPLSDLSIVLYQEYPVEEVYWVLPDATVVPGPTLTSGLFGEHLLIGISPAGCVGTWRIHIPVDTVRPIFFLEADTLGCDQTGQLRTIVVDPLTSVSWNGPNGFVSSEFDPMVTDTGSYVASVIAPNGCSNEMSIHVGGDFKLPLALLSLEELSCLSPVAELVAHSPDSILSYVWKDESGDIISMDSIVSVTEPGTYTIELEGDNHCTNIDTIVLGSPLYPDIVVATDTITCAKDTVAIVAGSTVIDPVFAWLGLNGDSLSHSATLNAFQTGPFVISITAPNGCEKKDTLQLEIDTTSPVPVINLIGELRCQNRNFSLDANGTVPGSANFLWHTGTGMILSDPSLISIDALDTGLYYFAVTDPANGCQSIDSIRITEHPDAIQGVMLEVLPPACSGDSNAQITITDVTGGIDPFLFRLNSSLTQTANIFQNLGPGDFLLEIEDSAGCIYDSVVSIIPTNPYYVDAGPDQEIFIGEEVILSGITDILPGEILLIEWDSLGTPICSDCPEFEIKPEITTTYRFKVASQTGCVLFDEMTVYVIEKGKFYLPNVFTPNNDQVNDEIRFHATSGISKVLKWVIFDRWGDAVFGRTDFDPSDPSIFWDGTTLGSETLNPGVFPYVVEIELINGNREVHHGTITLIR